MRDRVTHRADKSRETEGNELRPSESQSDPLRRRTDAATGPRPRERSSGRDEGTVHIGRDRRQSDDRIRPMSSHDPGRACPFALWTAFPSPWWVAYTPRLLWAPRHLGTRAPKVDPRVRPCRTSERDLGVRLIFLVALTGQRSMPRSRVGPARMPSQSMAPVTSAFPTDVRSHLLEIRLQAIQLSPYHAGPATPHP